MSSALETKAEELFIRAINEGAGTALAALTTYVGGLAAVHYAEDGKAAGSALSIEANEGEQLDEGLRLWKVDVVIRLRTLSTVPVADEDAAWSAITQIVKFMGKSDADNPVGLDTQCPNTATWSQGVLKGPIFRYSKSKVERQPGNTMRHREFHLPIETKLA